MNEMASGRTALSLAGQAETGSPCKAGLRVRGRWSEIFRRDRCRRLPKILRAS